MTKKTIERPGTAVPGIEDITRRDFLVGCAAALLLGGCGSNSRGDDSSGETRTVEDGAGRSVEVPVDPRRVVVLDQGRVTFHLVELGLTPIGATTNPTTLGGDFPEQLGEAREEIEPVGDLFSPSLERIAALEPDLIFFTPGDLDVDRLSEIAPTVVYDFDTLFRDTAKSMRFVTRVVGREEEAERVIERFDERLRTAAQRLGLRDETFSIPALYSDDPTFALFGPEFPLGSMVERLGGEVVPKGVGGERLEYVVSEISLERAWSLVDADKVLLLRYTDRTGRADENFGSVTGSAVWRAIPAVERGDVIVMPIGLADGTYSFTGLERALGRLVEELPG